MKESKNQEKGIDLSGENGKGRKRMRKNEYGSVGRIGKTGWLTITSQSGVHDRKKVAVRADPGSGPDRDYGGGHW